MTDEDEVILNFDFFPFESFSSVVVVVPINGSSLFVVEFEPGFLLRLSFFIRH